MANFKTPGDWSTTASNNSSVDSTNIAENCAMAGLNNMGRAIMAGVKGQFLFNTASSGDTYTAAMTPTPDGYSTGMFYGFQFSPTNTGSAPTINLNSLGAKTIVQKDGSSTLSAGDLNGAHVLEFDGTNMRLINPAATVVDATNGGMNVSGRNINIAPSDLLVKAAPTTTDSIMIMDAAASNVAKTATLPNVVGALFSPLNTSLSANVAMTNSSVFFDGPTIVQGSTGTWLAMGTITVADSAGAAGINAKLWDGTTVIASGSGEVSAANAVVAISLSGFLASPAGNIRISAQDGSSGSGSMKFNASGASKDCTLTVIRIK